jgi:hypothetical protein
LQGVSFRNTSDRMFLTQRKTASGDNIGVQFTLPADAQNITLDQSVTSQFVIDQANGPTIQGVIPIAPKGSTALPYGSRPRRLTWTSNPAPSFPAPATSAIICACAVRS